MMRSGKQPRGTRIVDSPNGKPVGRERAKKSRGLQPARMCGTSVRTTQRASGAPPLPGVGDGPPNRSIIARTSVAAAIILATATVWTNAQPQEELTPTDKPNVRFIALDIHIDAGETPLAAYQFELTAAAGDFKIVGLEGGEHTAFAKPPYYDKKALSDSTANHDRVIVAAYDTGDDLPTASTRVARVHVQITGEPTPDFTVKLIVAASAGGETLDATATCSQGT